MIARVAHDVAEACAYIWPETCFFKIKNDKELFEKYNDADAVMEFSYDISWKELDSFDYIIRIFSETKTKKYNTVRYIKSIYYYKGKCEIYCIRIIESCEK